MTTRIFKTERYIPTAGNPVFQVFKEAGIDGRVIKLDPTNPDPDELDDALDQFAAAQQNRIDELEAEIEAANEKIAEVDAMEKQVSTLQAKIEKLTALPPTITPRQAKLALYGAGLLDDVEEVVSKANRVVQIHYHDAIEWRRDDPVMVGLASEIGITDEQLDQLFAQAKTL